MGKNIDYQNLSSFVCYVRHTRYITLSILTNHPFNSRTLCFIEISFKSLHDQQHYACIKRCSLI